MNKQFYEKIMSDVDFRKEFKNAPEATFKKYDINVYEDKKIIVHENTTTELHYALLPEGTDLVELNVPDKFKQIQKKAWEDKEYFNMLLSSPKEAVSNIFGSIPESLKISFHAYNPDVIHIILPEFPNESDELSDDDLEMVAGGKSVSGKKIINDLSTLRHDVYNALVPDEVNDTVKTGLKKTINLVGDIGGAAQNFFSGW